MTEILSLAAAWLSLALLAILLLIRLRIVTAMYRHFPGMATES